MASNIRILSTAPLHEDTAQILTASNLRIEVVPFIETKSTVTSKITHRIAELEENPAVVIFTSKNAVNAIKPMLSRIPDWKIFCIQGKTSESVATLWAKEQILGVAPYGKELGEQIMAYCKLHHIKELVFFCGNTRLDTIPAMAASNNITIEELTVYETIPVPRTITKVYDAILFFSPSAADSFFAHNTMAAQTVLFAIGTTTKAALEKYCSNKIITGEFPDKTALLHQLVNYFNSKNYDAQK